MKDRHNVQYTIRNVPHFLDEALRRQAKRLGLSLNAAARQALAKGAGVEGQTEQYDDLNAFFGSWIEDPRVNRALAEQKVIDHNLWR